LIVTLFCVLLLVAAAQKKVQTETVLYNFGGFSGDGGLPYGGLLYHKGTLYGTTGENAPNGGSGTVFEIASTGQNYKVLYNFCSLPGCTDGGEPLDLAPGLVLRDGKLYGTTSLGGDLSSSGTVFNLTLDGIENTIYRFDNQSGSDPETGVVFDEEGNLYGTTWGGGEGRCPCYGNYTGCGTVFELTAAREQKLLHSFGRKHGDATYPLFGSLVFDKKGNLYGTTGEGGIYGDGTVFELTSKGKEKIPYSFGAQPNDGIIPEAGVVIDTTGIFTAQRPLAASTVGGRCSNNSVASISLYARVNRYAPRQLLATAKNARDLVT